MVPGRFTPGFDKIDLSRALRPDGVKIVAGLATDDRSAEEAGISDLPTKIVPSEHRRGGNIFVS